MKTESIKYKANYYALLLLAFVIPLERKLIAPMVILFLITCLINLKPRQLGPKNNLFFGGFYLLYLVGMAYTNNFDYGTKDLMTKLPLLLLPLGFYISSLPFSKLKSKAFSSFIDGCLVSFLIAFIHSSYQYVFTLDISHFFYHKIALFSHPSYLAMMFTFATALLYVSILSPNRFSIKTSKKKQLILIFIFSVYSLLLLSKTGILTNLLVHAGALIYWLKTSKKYALGIGIMVAIIGLFTLAYSNSSTLQSRFNELGTLSSTDGKSMSSSSSRLSIWKISGSLIKESPVIGHGTGDVKDLLINSYKENQYDYLVENKLNAHNQLIQTTLALGIIGALYLVLMILLPAFFGIKNKNYILLFFLILVVINFATESMLERQVGVTFYALFNLLCLSEAKKEID